MYFQKRLLSFYSKAKRLEGSLYPNGSLTVPVLFALQSRNTVFAVIQAPEKSSYKSDWLLCLNKINTLPLRVVLKLRWRLIN